MRIKFLIASYLTHLTELFLENLKIMLVVFNLKCNSIFSLLLKRPLQISFSIAHHWFGLPFQRSYPLLIMLHFYLELVDHVLLLINDRSSRLGLTTKGGSTIEMSHGFHIWTCHVKNCQLLLMFLVWSTAPTYFRFRTIGILISCRT